MLTVVSLNPQFQCVSFRSLLRIICQLRTNTLLGCFCTSDSYRQLIIERSYPLLNLALPSILIPCTSRPTHHGPAFARLYRVGIQHCRENKLLFGPYFEGSKRLACKKAGDQEMHLRYFPRGFGVKLEIRLE